MSLAALGCNPSQTGDSLADVGGHNPGTLAYSPDGGLYMLVKAQGAITAGALCKIVRSSGETEIEAQELNTAGATHGFSLCIPQVAIADNAYGWALVFGHGTVEAGAVAVSAEELSTTTTLGRVDDTDSNGRIGGLMPLNRAAVTAGNQLAIFATWPHLDLVA